MTFASGSTGTLDLGLAQTFAGTIAGFSTGDAIDLENFAYSTTKLSITGVTGTGAEGTDTIVTVADKNLTATITLLNQYAGQYGTSASDYTLSSDQKGTTPGTLLELATAHA